MNEPDKTAKEILDAEWDRVMRLVLAGRMTAKEAADVLLDTHITLYGTGEPPKFAGAIKGTEKVGA